ncbi:MAG TPA: class E sortase, partial [Acidimicrobiales bacterium]|nr:class E sortase [Acidimicrobiales bacterium]
MSDPVVSVSSTVGASSAVGSASSTVGSSTNIALGPGRSVPGTPVAAAGRSSRARRLALGAAATVTAFGVVVALLAGYLFGFTALQHARAQQRLLAGLNGKVGLTALSGRIPAEGRPVAILEIPVLHLEQVVVAGTSAVDLASGPGLMPGSAPPGVRGNTVIAGRRLLYGHPFSGLGRLRRGDRIHIIGGLGSFDYRVVST